MMLRPFESYSPDTHLDIVHFIPSPTMPAADWPYKLPTNVLGNSWRPVSINGTQLFDTSNTDTNVLNFVNNSFIHVSKTTDANTIQFTPNYSTFTKIKFGETEVAATGITDILNLVGDNITITNIGNTEEKKVYLTFDAGYEAGYMPQILDALKNSDIKATFFLAYLALPMVILLESVN